MRAFLLTVFLAILFSCNTKPHINNEKLNPTDSLIQASESKLKSVSEEWETFQQYSKWESSMRALLLKEGKTQLKAQKEIDSIAKQIYGTPLPDWLDRHMKVMDSIIKSDYKN